MSAAAAPPDGEVLRLAAPTLSRLLVELAPSTAMPAYRGPRVAFLGTKNRSDRLRLTLPGVAAACEEVHVIDSSQDDRTRELCAALGAGRVRYHGWKEQQRALRSEPVLQEALAAGFITRLSAEGWDIWSKRNYALLLALLGGLPSILLIDDDVIAPAGLIDKAIALSRHYAAVGARVSGMPDVSIVDHVSSLHGVPGPIFVSGHFLALDVGTASRHYFANVYNEDWMFAMLNSLSAPVACYGTVFQLYWNPFDGTGARAAFEEKGEVLVQALAGSILGGAGTTLLDCLDHWSEVLAERRETLSALASSSLVQSTPAIAAILDSARAAVAALTPQECLSVWTTYNDRLGPWRSLVRAARCRGHAAHA